jgi:hypothetical protein
MALGMPRSQTFFRLVLGSKPEENFDFLFTSNNRAETILMKLRDRCQIISKTELAQKSLVRYDY